MLLAVLAMKLNGDDSYTFQELIDEFGYTDGINFKVDEDFVSTCKSLLPVELVGFTTKVQDNQTVKLNQQTASEINNDYFTIQRSTDRNHWEDLDKVNGVGNTTSFQSYSAIDENPNLGTSYYRLKQTDFDGKFEYSKLQSVKISRLVDAPLLAYPSPASYQITVEGSEDMLKSVKVYNMIGQDVSSTLSIIDQQETQVVLNISNLPVGAYIIKTDTGSTRVYKQ